jgi:nucleotide sugar dehydrogenase
MADTERRLQGLTANKSKILIVGLGQIGYHDAEYMTSRGLSVDGYDVNPKATQRAVQDGILRKQAITFKNYDYYVIAVSTHNPLNIAQPSFDALFQTAERLSYEGKENGLVAIESTVTLGTSEEIKDILGHRLHVAHVPHRFYGAEKVEHGVRQLRVLGGCEKCCTEKAVRFYKETLDIPVYRVSSIELAELSKVIENSYRFLEIAYAEELKMLCDAYCLNFEELRGAVNSKWNVKILEARQGIDGHCLPKDSQMYLDLSNSVAGTSVIDSAKVVDREYKRRLTQDNRLGAILPNALPHCRLA